MTFELRQFQKEVQKEMLSGKSILLQAPTGAGKTLAAWRPALLGFDGDPAEYPQRLIHAVPMRVLARSFLEEFTQTAQEKPKWRQNNWYPTIQTGEQANDQLFENRMLIATVDQVLASFLNIPYGIPKRLDNINAGAMIGSYLIFDEFHLYPTKQMLLTVLAMLKMLKGVSRFTLMSATFSPALLETIASELGAHAIFDPHGTPLTQGIFSDIAHLQSQERTWRVQADQLNAAAIQAALREHRTALVICNQVNRAQEVYREFMATQPENTDCVLLHSRFYPHDRRNIEDTVLSWLQENAPDDGRKKVVIATQVVEVGLDISAEILLTECAPAASLIQRAGRCARWGSTGDVWVYQPLDADKKVNYAPYIEDEFDDVCRLTWDTLSSSDFDGKVLQYDKEQALVQAAHEDHDKKYLINGLGENITNRIDDITRCMNERDEGFVSDLIRKQDNSSARLYIMGNPQDERITHELHQVEALNVSKGVLRRAFEQAPPDTFDADFIFRGGREAEEEIEEAEQIRNRKIHLWDGAISEPNDVYGYRLLLAHPTAIAYTPDIGLHIPTNSSLPADESPEVTKNKSKPFFSYNADTYVQHINGLYRAYREIDDNLGYHISLKNQTRYAIMQLLQRMGHNTSWDDVDRYLRLMLALHDVGKLNTPWQNWALERQRFFDQFTNGAGKVPTDGRPLAHTDKGQERFMSDLEYTRAEKAKIFEEAFKKRKIKSRGNHSVESAEAVTSLVWDVTKGDKLWFSVIIAAICHHHTPTAHEAGKFSMVENGKTAIAEALKTCGFESEAADWADTVKTDFSRHSKNLTHALKTARPDRNGYDVALLYFLCVRVLRLADQRSSDYIHKGANVSL